MIIDKLEEIDRDFKQYPAMANTHDTAVQVALIDSIVATSVCELGAGTGNWSGVVARNLQNKNTKFTLVENFTETTQYKNQGFPQNYAELKQNMDQFKINYNIIESDHYSLPELEEKVDVIRIDCDGDGTHYAQLSDWLLRNGSEKLIIFADDVRPNVRPDRMFMLHELVRRGDLEFLWGGYEEAAWCRPGVVDKITLVKELQRVYNEYYDFIHYARHNDFFGSTMSYIVTRPKWIVHVPGL